MARHETREASGFVTQRSAAGGAAPPRCAVCGDVLGVYERMLWRRPDRTVVACGWLEARADVRHAHPHSVFFHVACGPDASRAP